MFTQLVQNNLEIIYFLKQAKFYITEFLFSIILKFLPCVNINKYNLYYFITLKI